jgi:transcriptional regulator with XRE-family HTH domain
MSPHKLSNYLRSHRKRVGLSQAEVAFLLGCSSAAQLSRYEHFSRVPTLRTALALAVIFQASARDLFSGEYQKVENAVCRQAHRLLARLANENPDQATARKLALLKAIVTREVNHS